MNNKTLSEKLAVWAAIGILITIMWALSYTRAFSQSFYPYRGHKVMQSAGQTIKRETFGEKIRDKISHNRKRHHQIGYAIREMRRKSRGGRL